VGQVFVRFRIDEGSGNAFLPGDAKSSNYGLAGVDGNIRSGNEIVVVIIVIQGACGSALFEFSWWQKRVRKFALENDGDLRQEFNGVFDVCLK
jgi:hypothetical protein